MINRIKYEDLISETRKRGIKTAIHSVIDNGEDETGSTGELTLVVDNNLDEIAITGDVKVGISKTSEEPTSFTNPTWFQLLKFYDDYISCHEESHDKIYFEGVIINKAADGYDVVYGN